MQKNGAARRTLFCLLAATLAWGSQLAAQVEAKAKPNFQHSLEDKAWRTAQDGARPWTREEMLSAQPLDLPEVSEDTLRTWALEALTKTAYDVRGGPGLEPGFAPGDSASKASAKPENDAVQAVAPKGYSYPAPYTRYETFPNYNSYPHSTVGKVFFSKPGAGNFVCSASSIGSDAVITAAHCVHDGATNTFWTNWVFVPAYKNGSAPFGQWTANHLWFNVGFLNGQGGDFRYDFGGAVLNRNRAGQKISQRVGALGFTWNQNNAGTGAHWAIIGYPAAAPFNGSLQFICQTSYAYSAEGSAPTPIGVGCDQTGGTSGGPWIRSYSGTSGAVNLVNGVNSYRRCANAACTSLYTQELFSPYFDNTAKGLRDCLVNSVPGNPADPARSCAPGT